MKRIIPLLIITISLLTSCNSLEQKKNRKTAKDFYTVYGERKDLNKLMDYYAPDIQLIDAVPQVITEGKENVKKQFNWNDPNYKKHPNYSKTVTIDAILSNDSLVVVSGEYNPYYYNEKLVDKMKFNTWLYFNKDGKIKKQIEWVQYPVNVLQEIIQFKQTAEIH